MKKLLLSFLQKQYAAIGGQAVIEGVMMRSPHAFVVAVRKPDGTIRLRRDQWFGLGHRFPFMKKPFLRGILTLVESMANGLVALNYSADVAMHEELKQEAMKKGKTEDQFLADQKKGQTINWGTFLTMVGSFAFGILLFVAAPHAVAVLVSSYVGAGWDLESMQFHAIDGVVKGSFFLLYVWGIGQLPDIKKVFQYHGAEHKSIATFEAEQELTVENAQKFSTLHPRCGTSFLFFLIFISIVLFTGLFALIPVGRGLPTIPRHILAIVVKIAFVIPIAGISYEVIKWAGACSTTWYGKMMSWPGMMLQKLTTRAPTSEQLEVALASIKAVLQLENAHNLREQNKRVLTLEEIDINNLSEIQTPPPRLKDFLEA